MKNKLFHFGLLIASLLGYLEWGETQAAFLFEMELDVFKKLFSDPLSVAHPLILVPLIGQILIIINLFKETLNKKITYAGITCIGLLYVILLLIQRIAFNLKGFLSLVPFFTFAILIIRNNRKRANIN